jgi:diguanylate cyclase (GGDEF)-like protein/PAS domain S-box-containing protein
VLDSHILILDDDPQILKVLSEFLVSEGYRCSTSDCSDDVIERLRTNDFDMLITDIQMPKCSGIEVTSKAKALNRDLSVVVMTGINEVGTAVQAMRAGADDYVLKPFDFSEISIAVSNGLEKRILIQKTRSHESELELRVKEATFKLKESNLKLFETKTYLDNLIDSTVDAIISVDTDEVITFANRGAQRMVGFKEEEITKMRLSLLLKGGVEECQYIRRVLRLDKPLQNYETELVHHNDSRVPVNISFSLVPNAQGEVVSMLAICKDITEQKRLQEELKEMTIRDGLTGLYNLRYFYERLETESERARRQEHTLSMLLIDVDQFKTYNDAHGHLEGDKVLQAVASVINECTREHVDMGFRYGGDEFTVILTEAQEEQALTIANRILETFEAKRFDLLTLSIGLMTYDKSYNAETLIKFTDSMMYDAKRSGGNRVYVYKSDARPDDTEELSQSTGE